MSNDEDPRAAVIGAPSDLDIGNAIDWSSTGAKLQRIESSRLIRVGDLQGVFTPIAGAADPGTSASNLELVIATLKTELQRLEKENLSLRGQLEALAAERQRSPDDFASAVSHTLDTLQTRLNDTKNPVSRFAVRSFSIEASVFVDVSPLGTIDYRFTQPGEAVDPARLSKIKLDVVPLPKDSSAGTWTLPEFTPFLGIEEIQGVGEQYQKRLNAQQIYTVGDLLTAATRARGQVQLAALLDVDRTRLSDWLAQAELMTIKDIDGRHAEVLFDLGIRNLTDLAAQPPAALTESFNTRAAALGHKTLQPVTAAAVKIWVDSAVAYAGRVAGAVTDPAGQ